MSEKKVINLNDHIKDKKKKNELLRENIELEADNFDIYLEELAIDFKSIIDSTTTKKKKKKED